MHEYEIYTDGGFSYRTGRGAWAFLILKDGERIFTKSGCSRMHGSLQSEIAAAVSAVGELPHGSSATLYTDCESVITAGLRTQNETWNQGWFRPGGRWEAFYDLLVTLKVLLKTREISWRWVKGHNGHPHNGWCHRECSRELRSVANSLLVETAASRTKNLAAKDAACVVIPDSKTNLSSGPQILPRKDSKAWPEIRAVQKFSEAELQHRLTQVRTALEKVRRDALILKRGKRAALSVAHSYRAWKLRDKLRSVKNKRMRGASSPGSELEPSIPSHT